MENRKLFCVRLLLLAVVFLIVGCGPGPDDIQVLKTMRIENRSAHDLEITSEGRSYKFIPKKLHIKSGETYSVSHNDNDLGVPCPETAFVRFGADVSTVHYGPDGEKYHNFCDPEAFQTVSMVRGEMEITFIFTDADYDYAVEHPVPTYNLTVLHVENLSSYDLEIKTEGALSELVPATLSVGSGETFSVSGKTDEDYLPWTVAKATVRFGTDVVTVHRADDRNEYHNFCFPPLYVTDTGYRTQSHTFTFTDLDYESAKKRPQFVSI